VQKWNQAALQASHGRRWGLGKTRLYEQSQTGSAAPAERQRGAELGVGTSRQSNRDSHPGELQVRDSSQMPTDH